MPKTALVAGSTGLVGKQLVKILSESHEYEAVIALVRKGSNYIHDDVFTVEIEYEKLAAYSEELKADDVFCCLGTTMKKAGSKDKFQKVDYEYPLELAKVAAKNGSDQFNIISASRANADSMIFYNKVKGNIEKAITSLQIPTINIFRPSLLLGTRDERRTGEQIGAALSKLINPLLVGRFKKYRSIKASVVARAMFSVNQKHLQGIHIYESNRIQELGRE